MKSEALEVVSNSTGVRAFDVLRRYISAMGQRSPNNEPRKMLVRMCKKLLREEKRVVKRIKNIEREINSYEMEAKANRKKRESVVEGH